MPKVKVIESTIVAKDRDNRSATEKVASAVGSEEEAHRKLLCITSGKYCTDDTNEKFHNGSGRTLNIPKIIYPGHVPGPSYNGAVTIGKACKGNHCYTPISNKAFTEANNQINMNIPFHNPSLLRPGNNTVHVPIKKYTNNGINYGPFNIDILE
jgi:hypothetical protein